MMNKYESTKNELVKKDLKVAVVGGRGYAGLELVRLLQKHPAVQLRVCFSTGKEFNFADYLPSHAARGIAVVGIEKLKEWIHEFDSVFLATPAEVSLEISPLLLEAGVNVIDLSGAFRLKKGEAAEQVAQYEQFYGFKHPCPHLLNEAQYGLVPWNPGPFYQKGPVLVANPGCYATAVLMALLPLLKRDLVEADNIVIDAKSGTSGAGRKAAENLLFTEIEGECLPYKIGKHQHLPEITQCIDALSGKNVSPVFATHLLPIRRGILASIYTKLKPGVTGDEITAAYCQDYSDYGLVEWSELHGGTDRSDMYGLSLKRVVGTDLTRLLYQVEGDRLFLFSMIDNLVKGAAGQAVENFNALHHLPVSMGLTQLEGVL